MTSVTAPILDRRNYTVIKRYIRSFAIIFFCTFSYIFNFKYSRHKVYVICNKVYIIMHLEIVMQVKTANLLGIVGTDVPVEEIQKLVPPYKVSEIMRYNCFHINNIFIINFHNIDLCSQVSTDILLSSTITVVFYIIRICDHW